MLIDVDLSLGFRQRPRGDGRNELPRPAVGFPKQDLRLYQAVEQTHGQPFLAGEFAGGQQEIVGVAKTNNARQ